MSLDYHAKPWSFAHRPSHTYSAGTEHVGFATRGRHRVHQARNALFSLYYLLFLFYLKNPHLGQITI